MATYFVSSAGSNTAPYDTWAKAATLLSTALAAATTAGDIIALDVGGVPAADKETSATTTWTFAGHVALICSTNSGTATVTPTAMNETTWIGHSTAPRNINLAGAKRVYIYGLTIRTAGGMISVNITDGGHFKLDACQIWQSSTDNTNVFVFGNVNNGYTLFEKSLIKNARNVSAGSTITINSLVEFVDSTLTWATTVSTALFGVAEQSAHCEVNLSGCDLSSLGSSTLVADNSRQPARYTFAQCKLGASAVILGTQSTVPNKGSAFAYVFDCSSGDTHGMFGYYDALGSLVYEGTIKFTAGAAAQSWKITTSANCSYYTPFVTPWVDLYNTATSAVTPWFEVARDGSSTAYQNDEVWAQFLAKTTSGTTKSSLTEGVKLSLTDKAAGTTPTDITSGTLGDWSPGSGSPDWAGRCAAATSITPAETGHIRGRIVVGEPSITVYVDPQIRT